MHREKINKNMIGVEKWKQMQRQRTIKVGKKKAIVSHTKHFKQLGINYMLVLIWKIIHP